MVNCFGFVSKETSNADQAQVLSLNLSLVLAVWVWFHKVQEDVFGPEVLQKEIDRDSPSRITVQIIQRESHFSWIFQYFFSWSLQCLHIISGIYFNNNTSDHAQWQKHGLTKYGHRMLFSITNSFVNCEVKELNAW